MRLKILLLPAIIVLGFTQLFSSSHVRLDKTDLAVQPGPHGNPTVLIDGEMYYIRDWEPVPGCYRLMEVGWIDYNFASPVDEGYCQSDG